MNLKLSKIVLIIFVFCLPVMFIIGCKSEEPKATKDTIVIYETKEEETECTDKTSESIVVSETIETTKPTTEPTTEPVTEPVGSTVETVVEETEPVTESTTSEVEETTVATEEVEYRNLINLGEFRLTAYCSCQICCGEFALNRPVDENGKEVVYGSIGVRLAEGVSIAVDPNVIKYGSKVVIGDHTYIAQDTGGAIKGNRIDIYFENHQSAKDFGTQYKNVYLVQE